ncbi:putative type I DNA modification enzyme [Helicobacter pylori Hp P-62]|nr:putative type I DNA modification enzyme [Helicobacter pylori Hp P-62]
MKNFKKNEINKFLGKISSIKERYAHKSAVLKNAFINNDKLLKHVFLSDVRN